MFTILVGFATVFGVVLLAVIPDFAPVFVLVGVDFAVGADLVDLDAVVFFAAEEAEEFDFDEVDFEAVGFAVDFVADFGFGERNNPLLLPKSCPKTELVKTNKPNTKITVP